MIKQLVTYIILGAILVLGFELRARNYATVPLPGQSMDEYSNSWVGFSLLNLGVPVGLSGIDGYPFSDMRYINVDRVFQGEARGNPLPVNYPWFDHPPLLGLITGGFAKLRGAEVFEDTTTVLIRKPMLALGTLSILLVYALASINFGKVVGLVAAMIYATNPLVVVTSRMIQGENGVIPLFLLGLIGITMYLKTKKWGWLLMASIAGGMATLFKLSGGVVFLAGLMLLKKKDWWWMVLVGGLISGLYVVYGAVYDWNLFVKIFGANAGRFYGLGPAAFVNLMTEIRVTHDKYMSDPWPLALWIGWLALMVRNNKVAGEKILTSGIVAYLITYIFLGSWPYGWYALPFWPLLTIVFAKVMVDLLRENRFLPGVLLLWLPVGTGLTKFVDIGQFQGVANFWRWGVTGLLWLAYWNPKQLRWVLKIILIGLFLLAIYLNVQYSLSIDMDKWFRVN